MAKKRNTGRVRPQEYPDDEEFSYIRDKMQAPEPDDEPAVRPAKKALDYAAESKYREGQVVTIAALQEIGTVVQSVGKDLMVLDTKGILHVVKDKDVYLTQP